MEIRFAHYGEERTLGASADEIKLFECIRSLLADSGVDPGSVMLVRKSDSYLTIICRVEIARIKYTERAKWISIQIVDSLRSKYLDSPLFDAQKKKGQLFWKSSINVIDDITTEPTYRDVLVAACREGF